MRTPVQSLGDTPFVLSGARAWSGTQVFNANVTFNGAAGSSPTVQFRSVVGQTGNLVEFWNNSGTRVAFFDQSGNFSSIGAQTFTSSGITQPNATVVAFTITGAASGTADLQQWKSSSGSILAGINASGQFYGGGGGGGAGGLSVTGDIITTKSVQAGTGYVSLNGSIDAAAVPATGSGASKAAYFFGGNSGASSRWYGAVMSFNAYFDGTNWQVLNDNSNNEWATMTTSGGNIQFYGDISRGTTNRTLTPTQFDSYKKLTIETNTGNLDLVSGGVFNFLGTNAAAPSTTINAGGARLSLFNGIPATDAGSYMVGVEPNTMWFNSAAGYFKFYSAGVLNTFITPVGSVQRSSAVNMLLQRPAAATNSAGIRLNSGSGGTVDQTIMLIPNSEDLVFGTDNGSGFLETVRMKANNWFQTAGTTSLNLPQNNTEYLSPPATGVSIYVGAASSGASAGRFTFLSNGPTGNDGGYIQWIPASAGNTKNDVHFTSTTTSALDDFYLNAKCIVLGSNGQNGNGIMFRGDGWNTDPGLPWMRADGTNVVLNPHAAGGVYLAWDNYGSGLHVGGATALTGLLTTSGGITAGGGTNQFNSAVVFANSVTAQNGMLAHNSYGVVEGHDGNTPHVEYYVNAGSASINSQNTWGLTINYARAFTSYPGIGAICQTGSGTVGNVGHGIRNASLSSVSVYFCNLDSNTQTLSWACVNAIGPT